MSSMREYLGRIKVGLVMTEKVLMVFCGNVTVKLGIISESESAITSIYHWIGAMENFSDLIIEFQLATNPFTSLAVALPPTSPY